MGKTVNSKSKLIYLAHGQQQTVTIDVPNLKNQMEIYDVSAQAYTSTPRPSEVSSTPTTAALSSIYDGTYSGTFTYAYEMVDNGPGPLHHLQSH